MKFDQLYNRIISEAAGCETHDVFTKAGKPAEGEGGVWKLLTDIGSIPPALMDKAASRPLLSVGKQPSFWLDAGDGGRPLDSEGVYVSMKTYLSAWEQGNRPLAQLLQGMGLGPGLLCRGPLGKLYPARKMR